MGMKWHFSKGKKLILSFEGENVSTAFLIYTFFQILALCDRD